MTRIVGRIVGAALAVLLVLGLAAPVSAAPAATAPNPRPWLSGAGHFLHRGARGEADVNLCSANVAPGTAQCAADVRTDVGTGAHPQAGPVAPGDAGNSAAIGNQGAYDPSFLQSAYNAPSAARGTGQTVAIVDAYDAPHIEADLAQYRSFFDLPPCTTANGCFRKVNQTGGTNYPAPNAGWALEIALDVQMVSALCPNCHILLVEATTNAFANLGTAVNEAVALGANVVSNSYAGSEWSGEKQADAAYFDHPGVAIVAATGDNGYGVGYPAASPDVVGVGGTSLVQTSNTGSRNAVETAWSSAGSGCSAYEPKPAWQTDTGCARRTVGDVSAVADPATGVWVYSSDDGVGWNIVGGTSAATPIIGAFYALAGNGPSNAELASYPYANPGALNDVVVGTNGNCGGTYLCTSVPGFDGPTGLGTPNTAAAFSSGAAVVSPPPPPPPAPDFSVSASAVGALRAGATAKSTVTLTAQNGDTGTVKLTGSVSPATGLSQSFSPSSVVLGANPVSSALTFVAHKGGTYTVTITATQGALVHTTSLKVTVNDFSIRVAQSNATVTRGKPVHYSVVLTPSGSFAGEVTLSVAGLRSGDTVAFPHNPAPASGTQTVTIKPSASGARGTRTLRFTGVSGTLNHSVEVVLTVH